MNSAWSPGRAVLAMGLALFIGAESGCAARSDVDRLDKSMINGTKRVDALEDNVRSAQQANAKLGADLEAMREDVQRLSGQVDELTRRRPGGAGANVGGEDILPALTRLQNDVWELKVRAGLPAGPAPSPAAPTTGFPRAEIVPLPGEVTSVPGYPSAPAPPTAPPPVPPLPLVVTQPPATGESPLAPPPQPYPTPAYPSTAYPAPAPAAPAPGLAPVAPAAPPRAATAPLPAPSAASPEKQLYDEAIKLYEKKQWQAAREKLADFLRKYAASDLADNAHYWIGETYFSEGKYEPAFLEFEAVVKNYPKSDKACDARLRQGLSYKNLNYNVDARLAFQSVLKQCAGTDAAEKAKRELGQSTPSR